MARFCAVSADLNISRGCVCFEMQTEKLNLINRATFRRRGPTSQTSAGCFPNCPLSFWLPLSSKKETTKKKFRKSLARRVSGIPARFVLRDSGHKSLIRSKEGSDVGNEYALGFFYVGSHLVKTSKTSCTHCECFIALSSSVHPRNWASNTWNMLWRNWPT